MLQSPYLFGTLGFPGSGKTYFCDRFANDIKAFHINSDRLRLAMFLKPKYTQAENTAVFGTMDYIAEELLRKGISVVYDGNLNLRIHRQRLEAIAAKQKVNYALLYFKTPLELAKQRNDARPEGERVAEEVIDRMHRLIELPDNEPYIEIDGTADYSHQKASIINAIS